MKRTTLLYSTILSLGLLMGACAEDDGNYDYTPINSVTIEGLEEDLLVEAGSRLQLTPVLNITDESSINLSYEWTIGETVVSNERNLDIALPPLDYGEHLCALTIRDLDNGMQYRMTFSLTITNPFNYGYYFLTRMDDGSTEMAYIPANSEDASTAEDVMYATGVGEYPFGKEPAQIYGGYTYVNGTSCWQMTFLTNEGDAKTYWINVANSGLSMTEINDVKGRLTDEEKATIETVYEQLHNDEIDLPEV